MGTLASNSIFLLNTDLLQWNLSCMFRTLFSVSNSNTCSSFTPGFTGGRKSKACFNAPCQKCNLEAILKIEHFSIKVFVPTEAEEKLAWYSSPCFACRRSLIQFQHLWLKSTQVANAVTSWDPGEQLSVRVDNTTQDTPMIHENKAVSHIQAINLISGLNTRLTITAIFQEVGENIDLYWDEGCNISLINQIRIEFKKSAAVDSWIIMLC